MRLPLEGLSDYESVLLDCVTEKIEYFVDILAYFCPDCGIESFGAAVGVKDYASRSELLNYGLQSSDIMERHQEVARVEAEYFDKMEKVCSIGKCPFCGAQLSEKDGYKSHTINEILTRSILLTDDVLDPIFEEMKKTRKAQIHLQAEKKASEMVKKYNDMNTTSDILISNTSIQASSDMLITYVGHLMQLEMGIYSTELHLAELYEGKESLKLAVLDKSSETIAKNYEDIQNTEYELFDFEEEHDSFVSVTAPETQYAAQPKQPLKPVFNAQKPEEPSYEKPGVFNKKKVLAENEEKKRAYEQAVEIYKQKEIEYQSQMTVYAEQFEKYKAEEAAWNIDCQERDKAATKAYDSAVEEKESEFQKKIEEFKNRIAEKKSAILSTMINPDDNAGMMLLSKEISDGENLLNKLIEAKNQMYSQNVIYLKYRNLIAISSIYDYLVSGRCSNLTGSDGAYNLFESESKTNYIMTKLDDVVSSLDQIQENQYMLYQKISEINDGIKTINQSLEKVIISLSNIEVNASDMSRYLKSIDNNTFDISESVANISDNTEIMAHYSKINAFYAKRNTELMNALGYMVAFK